MTTILADRTLLDLIERLEATRARLEMMGTGSVDQTHFPMLTDNALRAAIDYLVELREARHAGIE
jgi:hypothetical protein